MRMDTYCMFFDVPVDDFPGGKVSWDLSGAINHSIGYDSLVVEDASSFGGC